MTLPPKPGVRPANPRFSSGPCTKHPGWSLAALEGALLGRYHRSKEARARLELALLKTSHLLRLPSDYRVGIVPASDTGAVEMALWSLLGPRGVDVLAWEAFGQEWVIDIFEQLKLADVRAMIAPYGELPDLGKVDFDRDVVFAWNGTTSGVRVPVAIGSRVIAKVSPSAMRPPRCSRKTSTGPSSMSRPSPGRRSWAARPRTA